jgi:hypothetical protein
MAGNLAIGQKELIQAKVMEQLVQMGLYNKEAAVKLSCRIGNRSGSTGYIWRKATKGYCTVTKGSPQGGPCDVGIRGERAG